MRLTILPQNPLLSRIYVSQADIYEPIRLEHWLDPAVFGDICAFQAHQEGDWAAVNVASVGCLGRVDVLSIVSL